MTPGSPPSDHPIHAGDVVPLTDLMFFCRHSHQPIGVVRTWSPEQFAQHMAALTTVLQGEGWNAPPAATTVINNMGDISNPEALNNPIGQRFEPGTPEAAAHPERVRPPNTPTEKAEAVGPARPTLASELQHVLNRCSAENDSNTPDFILAEFLTAQLAAFNHAVQERARWYGRMDEPGRSWTYIPDDDLQAVQEALHDITIRDHLPADGLALQPGETMLRQAVRLLQLARKHGVFGRFRPMPPLPASSTAVDNAELRRLRQDSDEIQRIRDLLHERRLRLQIESDDPVSYVDVIRGLIDDALVPSTDARDMAALRARVEAAERSVPAGQSVVGRFSADTHDRPVSVVGSGGMVFTPHEAEVISRGAMEAHQMRELLGVEIGDGVAAVRDLLARAGEVDLAVGDKAFVLNHTVTVTSLLDGGRDVEVELSPGGRREHVARSLLIKTT